MAPDTKRLSIQTLLEELLGSRNVYFQPPANVQMVFPCIVYHRDYAYTEHADDIPYIHCKRYLVTAISADPDSGLYDKLAALPKSMFNRFYTADNLNHDVFRVYF